MIELHGIHFDCGGYQQGTTTVSVEIDTDRSIIDAEDALIVYEVRDENSGLSIVGPGGWSVALDNPSTSRLRSTLR